MEVGLFLDLPKGLVGLVKFLNTGTDTPPQAECRNKKLSLSLASSAQGYPTESKTSRTSRLLLLILLCGVVRLAYAGWF